jgi:hypothetical protein
MTSKKQRLKRIRRLIEMNAPDAVLENDFISYLKAEHGGGLSLINDLTNKFFGEWCERRWLLISYFWNIRMRKQSERAFFANRIGMTEAEIALVENESEV